MLTETPVIEGYVRWLQTVTAHSTHRISQFSERDVRFRNPEAETTGAEGIATIYKDLFDDGQTVIIRVADRAQGQDGHTVYVRWERLCTTKEGHKQSLSGMSEVMVGLEGKIASITEYWDIMPAALAKRSFFKKLFG